MIFSKGIDKFPQISKTNKSDEKESIASTIAEIADIDLIHVMVKVWVKPNQK